MATTDVFSDFILHCVLHRYLIHKKNKQIAVKKKNPPVFPLLHTVFIDPVVINFSSIYSNKDLEVSETSGNLLHVH